MWWNWPSNVAETGAKKLFSAHRDVQAFPEVDAKYSRTPDGFPAGFLKSIASAIAFPLSKLFTMSMDCGCIPRVWKQAIVCPIFKKGSRKLPSNYRPVSLTSVCCKVMEYNALWPNELIILKTAIKKTGSDHQSSNIMKQHTWLCNSSVPMIILNGRLLMRIKGWWQ